MATKKRQATVKRVTGETDVKVSLFLDGQGQVTVNTGYKFLDHMLTLLGWFAFFDLEIEVKDEKSKQPDDHHVVEDVAITLGQAFRQAVGEMSWGNTQGISRYGSFAAVMDEAWVMVGVDVYTRGGATIDLTLKRDMVGDVSSEMIIHFLKSFAEEAKLILQVKTLAGENQHHIFESTFKSLGKALEQAVRIDKRLIKGAPGK